MNETFPIVENTCYDSLIAQEINDALIAKIIDDTLTPKRSYVNCIVYYEQVRLRYLYAVKLIKKKFCVNELSIQQFSCFYSNTAISYMILNCFK